jgi:putative addiction module CopG family antidote
MKIALPQSMEKYVNGLVEAGGYAGSEEVVEEALREHQARRNGMELVMTPELESLLDEGLENLERARTTEEIRGRK